MKIGRIRRDDRNGTWTWECRRCSGFGKGVVGSHKLAIERLCGHLRQRMHVSVPQPSTTGVVSYGWPPNPGQLHVQ